MSVKFLKKLSDEDWQDLFCCVFGVEKDELSVLDVMPHEDGDYINVWIDARLDDDTHFHEIVSCVDFDAPTIDPDEYNCDLTGWYIALYRKFGKEYSDAFFRNFWGIEEQEK